jgi:hypothetical protein
MITSLLFFNRGGPMKIALQLLLALSSLALLASKASADDLTATPYVCESGAGDATSQFVNYNGGLPLYVNAISVPSEGGAVFAPISNVRQNDALFSMVVYPTTTTPNLEIDLSFAWRDPKNGTSGRSAVLPTSIMFNTTGTSAKYVWDFSKINITTDKVVIKGPIWVLAKQKGETGPSGDVYMDNFVWQGETASHVMMSTSCPEPGE